MIPQRLLHTSIIEYDFLSILFNIFSSVTGFKARFCNFRSRNLHFFFKEKKLNFDKIEFMPYENRKVLLYNLCKCRSQKSTPHYADF